MPSSGPEELNILKTTKNEIRIYWTKVPESSRNGIITAYSICYKEYGLKHACLNSHEVTPNHRTHILSKLQPFTEYLIMIRAATIVGWGEFTSLRHRTLSARM